jgi:hypothetical protein
MKKTTPGLINSAPQTQRLRKPRIGPVARAEIARLYPLLPTPSQVKTFYAAMGEAIAAWQLVESALYEVYRQSTIANRPGAEACAFYAVPSFRTKLNMTSAAVQFALMANAALFAEWSTLVNQAGKRSDRRNEIAHGAVWTMFQEKRKDRKIYIGPNIMDFRHILKRKQPQETEPLTLARVRGYEKAFRLLAQQMGQFARRIPPP